MAALIRIKTTSTLETLKSRIEGENNGKTIRILDSYVYQLSEIYIACENTSSKTGNKIVFCVAGNVHYDKMYKGCDEDMIVISNDKKEFDGPSIYNCPDRILNMLTPTEEMSDHPGIFIADRWRVKCRENNHNHKQYLKTFRSIVKPGMNLFLKGKEKHAFYEDPFDSVFWSYDHNIENYRDVRLGEIDLERTLIEYVVCIGIEEGEKRKEDRKKWKEQKKKWAEERESQKEVSA